jgi:hypothetical protein
MRGIKSKAKKSRKLTSTTVRKFRRRVLSVSQLLNRVRQQRQQKLEQQKKDKFIHDLKDQIGLHQQIFGITLRFPEVELLLHNI